MLKKNNTIIIWIGKKEPTTAAALVHSYMNGMAWK